MPAGTQVENQEAVAAPQPKRERRQVDLREAFRRSWTIISVAHWLWAVVFWVPFLGTLVVKLAGVDLPAHLQWYAYLHAVVGFLLYWLLTSRYNVCPGCGKRPGVSRMRATCRHCKARLVD